MIAKKNSAFKAAVILLALVLITSCFVGGTFAKYVTSDSGSDSARVAKFGVIVTANGAMFATDYATDNGDVAGTIAKSVISSETQNVVAPGTKGDMVSMTITGMPEVAVRVTYEVTDISLDNWVLEDGSFYCPLKFKIGNDVLSGTDYEEAGELKTAISEKISSFSKDIAPNTDLGQVTDDTVAVSWEWPFETPTQNGGNRDADDTYLGTQATLGNAATVMIEIATTVTQID